MSPKKIHCRFVTSIIQEIWALHYQSSWADKVSTLRHTFPGFFESDNIHREVLKSRKELDKKRRKFPDFKNNYSLAKWRALPASERSEHSLFSCCACEINKGS